MTQCADPKSTEPQDRDLPTEDGQLVSELSYCAYCAPPRVIRVLYIITDKAQPRR
jgi:hypothetical protein